MLRIYWKDWCWSWCSNNLATWCEDLNHWKRPWCWEKEKKWKRIWWSAGITDSSNMSKLWVIAKDRETWRAAVHDIAKSLPGLHDRKRATIACLVKVLELVWGANPSCSLESGTWLRNKLLCYLSQWFGVSLVKDKTVLCLFVQSCLALCNPMDCSPPSSSVHGILQARILERVAMPSLRGSSQPRDRT